MKHHFHVFACVAGLSVVMSVACIVVATVRAENTNGTHSPTQDYPACEYGYSEWSECYPEGYKKREVLKKYPDPCEMVEGPILKEKCAYEGPKGADSSDLREEGAHPVSCAYTYSSWSECFPDGKQARKVLTKSPSGCVEDPLPLVRRTCTYISDNDTHSDGTNNTTLDSDSKDDGSASVKLPQCGYQYSAWTVCSESGSQTRTLLRKTPDPCETYEKPVLNRVCVPGTETKREEDTLPSKENPTSSFQMINMNEGLVLSGAFEIQVRVQNALKVEWYLMPIDSNTRRYLGSAYVSMGGLWVYGFDSARIPNGEYYLIAQVRTSEGVYEGDRVRIVLDNAVSSSFSKQQTSEQNLVEEDSKEREQSFNGVTSEDWQERHFGSKFCYDNNVCGVSADPDNDGLSNGDEYRVGTDPGNPDSDRDGFLDGDEVRNAFNPLMASPGDKRDKMIFQSPKEAGEVDRETYRVEKIERIQDEFGEEKLLLEGKGLPNSFVTIYIYSDPIILTVETDEYGNWSYILDKDIEDGEHEVYVAVTDNVGYITAKSEPLPFVKTAQAITVLSDVQAMSPEAVASPLSSRTGKDMLVFLAIAFSALAVAFIVMGIIWYSSKERESDNKLLNS